MYEVVLKILNLYVFLSFELLISIILPLMTAEKYLKLFSVKLQMKFLCHPLCFETKQMWRKLQ